MLDEKQTVGGRDAAIEPPMEGFMASLRSTRLQTRSRTAQRHQHHGLRAGKPLTESNLRLG